MPRHPQIPGEMLWVRRRFDAIDDALDELKKLNLLILDRVSNVTSDLEEQIRKSLVLTKQIDMKVPDE